jgi:hypothetical protein
MVNTESHASACAISIAAWSMSPTAPRFDAVAPTPPLGFDDVSKKPSFFFTVPARNPRTLCCCQSVACIISSILAPSDWLSRASTRSCLVTRSALGSSAFLSVLAAAARSAFDSTDRAGFLALAAKDVTLRRHAVFDWALPFLGAALFAFRDFMERVDIVWAPLVRGAGIDARTTQSPAHREASPKCFTRWPCPPAGTHSNASFAAEVQWIFEPRRA